MTSISNGHLFICVPGGGNHDPLLPSNQAVSDRARSSSRLLTSLPTVVVDVQLTTLPLLHGLNSPLFSMKKHVWNRCSQLAPITLPFIKEHDVR